MASLNFDNDGQLGSMELYSLQLQKVVDDFTEFDAITKAYVDAKVAQVKSELTDGASAALDTFKELEEYLEGSDTASGLVDQISALSAAITAEASRAGTEEGKLDSRVSALENDTSSATGISGVQTELDATQHGAGLDLDGSYVADSARNYISGATSLKSADALLDSALASETTARTAADTALSGRIATLEADPTTATAVAGETTARTAADTALSSRIATLEADPTTATAVASETTARAAADTALSGRIATLEDDPTTATALASETTDRTAADTALSGRIATLEADPTTATALANEITTIGQRITDLTTFDIAEDPDALYYTNQRVKDASVHNYAPFNPSEREYDPPVEVSVGYGFELLKAELQDIHTKEDADDTRHNDLTVSLSTVAGTVTTEKNRAEGAEEGLSERVAVFEGQLNNGNVPGTEYYVENLSVQGVVDDLRGAIDYVNGERNNNTNDINGLANDKYDKEGGAISGDATFEAKINLRGEANFEDNVNLQVQHANQDETTNGTGKYLYFSDKWRMYGKSDGSRLVFEYNGGTQETPNWKSAIPFISSV